MTHKPQRFQVYNELPDKSGFTIKDCEFVFKYDSHGGWYDEEKNYYNFNGEPATPPLSDEDAEKDPSLSSSHSDYSDGKDYEDFCEDIARQYEYDPHAEQENEIDEQTQNLQRIQHNKQVLKQYPPSKPLRVYYSNMPYGLSAQDVREEFGQLVLNAVPTVEESGKRTGEGYLVVSSKVQAKEIIQDEAKCIGGRPIYYTVQTLEQLLIDPIHQKYLKGKAYKQRSGQVQKKKEPVVEKQKSQTQKKNDKPAVSQHAKKQQKPAQVKKQAEPVKESVVAASQAVPEWVNLTFEINDFGTADKFKTWMFEHGFEKDKHYKSIKKITNPDLSTFGTVEVLGQHLKIILQLKYQQKSVFKQSKTHE